MGCPRRFSSPDDLLAPGRYRLTFEVDGAIIDPCWVDVDQTLRAR